MLTSLTLENISNIDTFLYNNVSAVRLCAERIHVYRTHIRSKPMTQAGCLDHPNPLNQKFRTFTKIVETCFCI